MTLKEAKDIVAKKAGFESWDNIRPDYEGRYFDDVAYLYAEVVAHDRVKYLVSERDELQQYKSNIEEWLRKKPEAVPVPARAALKPKRTP